MAQKKLSTFFGGDSQYALVIIILITIAGFVFEQPTLAMLFGFAVAGFSTISNDSIQTLGTFLSSNRKVPWPILWLFIGGVMAATISYGWYTSGGDLSFGRLNQIPEPTEFSFLQLLAPIILVVLTRFSMPVSTTFLILAMFSSPGTIQGMLAKTFFGYAVAFVAAVVMWGIIGYYMRKWRTKFDRIPKTSEKRWRILQWVSTALLWSAWLMQDFANATVFLPRDISTSQFVGIMAFMLAAMAFILYRRGGEIQKVVTEKTDVIRVKSATIIDFTYAIILFYFKELNDLPMSTTWVFLGMLAGREIALKITTSQDKPYSHTLNLVKKDILRAGFGLGISLALAFFANSQF